jgi:hypothetical protein
MRSFCRFSPLIAAAALSVCCAAQAQSTIIETIPGTPAEAPSADVGSSHSRGEALAIKQFGWLDVNHDGFLTRDEVALFPRLRDAFDQADQNHDNKVSLDEIRALALQRRAEKATPQPGTVVPPAAPAPVPATADTAIPPATVTEPMNRHAVPPKEW